MAKEIETALGSAADNSTGGLNGWDPRLELAEVSAGAARYSTGFLRAHADIWFKNFGSHWTPLAHGLGVDLRLEGIETGFDFPDELSRVTPIEVDGEIAVVGFSEDAQAAIVSAICPGVGELQQDILLEYIERRLISTLTKSWTGTVAPLNCHYIASDNVEEAEVVGVIALRWSLAGRSCAVWFGLGPRLLDRLDILWREYVAEANAEGGRSSARRNLSVELAELAVPPALLIDYMRSGTLINLGLPLSDQVTLKLDGKEWATGRLRRYEDRFAVEIEDFEPSTPALPEATTRVQVELFRLGVDSTFIGEHSQAGAILLTDLTVNSTASMVIGGESVATALIIVADGEFALSVLPK